MRCVLLRLMSGGMNSIPFALTEIYMSLKVKIGWLLAIHLDIFGKKPKSN